MRTVFNFIDRRGLAIIFLLLGLMAGLALVACTETATPGAARQDASLEKTGASPNGDGTTYPVPPHPAPTGSPQPGQTGAAGGTGVSGSGVAVGGVAVSPINPDALYQWVGEIVVSGVRGVEFSGTCGTWSLAFKSPEVESKAVNNAGKKIVLWGKISPVDSRPLIHVEAAYLADEPMPEIAVPEYPCGGGTNPPTVRPVQQMYSWVGVIVVSNLEGRHLELDRGCDSWVLMSESDELAKKLESLVGQKVVIWGKVSNDPGIYQRQTISVSSAFGPNDPMPMTLVAIPEYPCGGVVVPPMPPQPVPVYQPIDLQVGEIAAVGKIVIEGNSTYLVTPSGKILLSGYVATPKPTYPQAVPGEGTVTANPSTPSSVGGMPPSPPVRCIPEPTGEYLVVGKWFIKDSSLAIQVRYVSPWGYNYVCVEPVPTTPPGPPTPTPKPWPMPTIVPGTEVGVIYGQVKVGPLCPVEPCTRPTPTDLFSNKALVLQSSTGETIYVKLMQDGWFKQEVLVGSYVVTMTNCGWMGCKSAFPKEVKITAGQVTQLDISIDTGIR